MRFPETKWQERRGLAALIQALDGNVRYVGGAVRDTLLGCEVKDVDLATPLLPDDVIERLNVAEIKVVPTGIKHGTVTAILPEGPVEITTLRRDVSTDGRRATVAFSKDWKEDAARRDFTINALSVDPFSLEVFDYFDGLKDLDNREIRFIGSAEQRIAEDHLRIMRYFRFLARFGQHVVDAETINACRNASGALEKLSRERIADELMKLLATDDPLHVIDLMLSNAIFIHILPKTDVGAVSILASVLEREKQYDVRPDSVRRLVALLPKDAETAGDITKGLRFSKKLQQAVYDRVCARETDPDKIASLAYHLGLAAARDIILLFANDNTVSDCLKALEGWKKPVFPVKGGDLIAMGMTPGPNVSKLLAQVEDIWIAEGFPSEERVRNLLDQAYQSL